MITNRKNVLIALGLIVAIAGAALGSGAFTTVEADRGVSVETAGDANAYLAITPGDDYENSAYISNSTDSETLTIDLGQGTNDSSSTVGTGFNKNANTTLDGIIKLENQGENNVTVGVGNSNSDSGSASTTVELSDSEVTFEMSDGGTPEIAPGGTATINATVDTSASGGGSDGDLTIYAEENP